MPNSLHSLQNETSQTSSIGAVWPPAAGSYDRMRGFYQDGVIETAADCREMADLFQDYRTELSEHPELSRLSVRFVVDPARLGMLEAMGVNLEAAIPLGDAFAGMVVAYAGHNEADRQVDDQQLQRHGNLLQSIVQARQPDPGDKLMQLKQAGFTPSVIDPNSSSSERRSREQQFLAMYSIFGYDLADVREILSNESNTIVFVENGEEIVSTAMAERAAIPINGFGTLEMIEVTEASTRPDYRQRGLYKAVSGLLVESLLLAQSDDPVHAIYGESNLAMPGVLIAGHENGRRFSHFDRQRFGIVNPGFGVLPQNFHIEDGREVRPYNDFAVSYVPMPAGEL